jgi:hypothetical protein
MSKREPHCKSAVRPEYRSDDRQTSPRTRRPRADQKPGAINLNFDSDDVRNDVDLFIMSNKQVAAFPPWTVDHRYGEQICNAPLEIDGEILGKLELNAYPREPQPSYRIVLVFMGHCVCRLDFRGADGPHYNDADRPQELPPGPIYGQHVHIWRDNRRFARYNSIPVRLPNAREMQPTIRSFDSSLRWFCDEFSIDISGIDVPALPARDRLI